MKFHRTIPVAGVLAAAAIAAAAMPAQAAGRTTQTFTCDGQQVTIQSAYGHDGDTWSAAQIVDAGTLVPVSFEYLAVDETANLVLNDDTIAHGTAHDHQSTVTCQTSTQFTLGDVAPPGVVFPPGVQPTDIVSMSFVVTAVPRP
ncbi:MAG TPA: hypothetical protein VHO26_06950 [Propionibacteriaceae bacterium]|nr:hypothetical protein [Propionibacteriaceae bacterium]